MDQRVTELETKIDLKFKDVTDQLTLLIDIIQPDVVDKAPPVLCNSESPSDTLSDDKKDDPSDVSSTTVEQKSASFPDHLDPRISSRDPSNRPTIAQESPSDGSVLGISNRETSNRLFNPTIYSPGGFPPRRRKLSLFYSFRNRKDNKPYFMRNPENGYKPFGLGNTFNSKMFLLDSLSIKRDYPILFKAFHLELSTLCLACSDSANQILLDFDSIGPDTDFFPDFMQDNDNESSATARALFIALGQKMAARFKVDDFTCPINAPETAQIIKMNMLVDCGWHILQCLFNALYPRCGAILPNFDPHADLASLSILPNETQGSFLLRCTDVYNKFCMLRGPVPEFRLLDKVVSLLYPIPALCAPLSILMNAVTHHKMEYGHENNEFMYSIEDVPMLLKGGCIPLSHNLQPVNTPTNIASKESLSSEFCHPTDDDDEVDATALLAAFKGRRPRLICEVCFKNHSVHFYPARGPKFIHDALRRGEQYNLTHKEFEPKVPPRAPRPPPWDVPLPRSTTSSSRLPSHSSAPQDYASRRRAPSKPSTVT